MKSWPVATAADCRIGLHQDQGAPSGLGGRPAALPTQNRQPRGFTRSVDSGAASTNGLPGTNHAHLAASSQRFMGGHKLTELRTDLARVTFLDQMNDECLFGTDALS
jgi:hypothetical protein